MKQDSALYTQIPEDRMLLCRTSKLFAGVQITTYIKYNSSRHCSYAHGNHISNRRRNWKADFSDLWAIPQRVKYICIGIVGLGCPEGALLRHILIGNQNVVVNFVRMLNVSHLYTPST